jgi:hypothetical protein
MRPGRVGPGILGKSFVGQSNHAPAGSGGVDLGGMYIASDRHRRRLGVGVMYERAREWEREREKCVGQREEGRAEKPSALAHSRPGCLPGRALPTPVCGLGMRGGQSSCASNMPHNRNRRGKDKCSGVTRVAIAISYSRGSLDLRAAEALFEQARAFHLFMSGSITLLVETFLGLPIAVVAW